MNPTLDQLAYAALMVFVFSIPWSEELPNLGGVMAVRWLGLIALSMGVARAILAGRIRKLSVVHLAMIAFTMWSALSLLWTIDFDTTLTRAGTYLQLLTAVWLIWEVANTESRIAGLMAAYVMGAGAASFGSIANFLMGRTAAQLSAAEDAHQLYSGTRYTIEGTNANDLGLMLALSVPMSVYLLTRVKNGALSLLIWIQVAACVFALLLTASRGGMAAMGTGLLMLPFAWRRLPSTQRAVSIIATACIAVWAIWMIPPEIWQRLGRATTELESGTLTHRLDLWEGGLETFRDHPWLGVGSGTYGLAIMRLVDIPYAAHNTFLSVFVELGTLGGLLLLGLVGILVYCALRMRYLEACLWLTLLLTWGVGVSALTWEYRKPTWFLFGLLAAHAYVRRKWFAPKHPIFHEKRIYDRRGSYRYRPHFGGVRTARP
jgi:O-antigen ligase